LKGELPKPTNPKNAVTFFKDHRSCFDCILVTALKKPKSIISKKNRESLFDYCDDNHTVLLEKKQKKRQSDFSKK
jgi:hypothetical protein